ncbi:MAG: hypothetical protein JOZ25_09295 [Actinobacteria bacterium]|nr:hypothetical protein [Actinomycetota bacterium]
MRRVVPIVLAAVVALLVLSQLLIPPYLEHRAEKRLTAHGGHATVTIEAVPIARLLFDDGDEIKVRGEGLHVELTNGRMNVLSELDRFDRADVQLTSMSAGPFQVSRVSIARDESSRPYDFSVTASVTGRDLSDYAGSQLAGGLGGFIGRLGSDLVPFSAEPIPVQIHAAIRSSGHRAELESVTGSVAGIPAGPLAAAIAAAVANRL